MRGLAILLALVHPLTVTGWTLTWYSDDSCTTPLGHIEDSGEREGDFDSNVNSVIANWDSDSEHFIVRIDNKSQTPLLFNPSDSGKCLSPDSYVEYRDYVGWGFAPGT